jgi:hypothetical protein
MHAVTVRDTVSFRNDWEMLDDDGQLIEPAVAHAAKVLLDRLAWWATALRTTRTARPYAA